IALGGSLGAILGPKIADLASTFNLLVIAAVLLVAATLLFNLIERMHGEHAADGDAAKPIVGAGGFQLVLRDRYLMLIAALLIITNVVNTTGEYVLANAVRDHAIELAGSGPAAEE